MNALNLADVGATLLTSTGRRVWVTMHRLRIVVCLLGLMLTTAGRAVAQEAAESTAITKLYTSLLTGVGKSVGEEAAGWAMSAIGLAGDESGELDAISAQLQKIGADLNNINDTLSGIRAAIATQTCIQTQIASSLQNAVDDISQLYDEYKTYVANTALTPPVPPSQAQVLQWQNDVLAYVQDDLNAIHNAVYATVGANVIDACATATVASWQSNNPTATAATFLDDRPIYSQLVDIVNYYYGIYVEGVTILTEAYHLQACQFAAQDDPNLHCDFTTASTSTSASEVNTICDAPTALNVQRACLAAEEVVTFPETGTGMYERVEAWLKAAGAPYATDQLGILSSAVSGATSWDSSYAYLFPRDLLDFTNNATINGQTSTQCPSPLTSTDPCGAMLVGPYNLQLPSGLSYGGINGHWKSVTADVLLLLLAPYNTKSFGETSGRLGDFMASIGFSESLKSGDLIITTANTGINKVSGSKAICFMDTAGPRNQSKQPWCDGIDGQVQGTDNLLNICGDCSTDTEAGWTKDIPSQPAFYTAKFDDDVDKWRTSPGWLLSKQQNPGANVGIYWQYHWPATNMSEIGCQNGKPYTNPGGLLSRCAEDLQEYVDALLPPPDGNTTALPTSSDTTLLRNKPNRNTGEDLRLVVGSRGANEFVVHFADEHLERFLAGGVIRSAILRFSMADRGAPRRLEIIPIVSNFVEGKDSMGTGATWNCAEDADVSDTAEDCLQQWPASRFARGMTRKPDQQDLVARLIDFDVTADVKAGVSAWLIRSPQHGASHGSYYSREGALAVREPWRAPTLLLERRATDAVTRLRASVDR